MTFSSIGKKDTSVIFSKLLVRWDVTGSVFLSRSISLYLNIDILSCREIIWNTVPSKF